MPTRGDIDRDAPVRFASAEIGVRAAVARSFGVAPPCQFSSGRLEGWETWASRHRLLDRLPLVQASVRYARGVAFHEAGHLVAAHAVQDRLLVAEFAPGTSLGGFMEHLARVRPTARSLRASLTIARAGEEAFYRYTRNRADARASASADYEEIAKMRASGREAGLDVEEAWRTSRTLVDSILDECWPAVRTLARLLMRNSRLTANDCYRVLWHWRRRPSDDLANAWRTLAGRDPDPIPRGPSPAWRL